MGRTTTSLMLLSRAIKVSAIPISKAASLYSATKGMNGSTAMVLLDETEEIPVRVLASSRLFTSATKR